MSNHLTNLKMNLLKSSIVGTAYGVRFSEDGLATEKQMASDIRDQDVCFYKRVSHCMDLLALGISCLPRLLLRILEQFLSMVEYQNC